MDIYTLTQRGMALAKSTRSPATPEWGVVMFLAKHSSATKDQILSYVTGATTITLSNLKAKGIITNGV